MYQIKKSSLIGWFLLFSMITSCDKSETQKGDLFYKEGEYPKAVAAYTSYLSDHPKDSKSFYNRGRAHEEMGELEKALKDFKKASAIEPQNITFLMSLGIVQFKLKNFPQTVYAMESALKLKSNDAEAYYLLGRALQQQGKIVKALENYDNAIRYDSRHAGAYLSRGVVKAVTNKTGCEDIRKAKTLGDANAEEAMKKYCL